MADRTCDDCGESFKTLTRLRIHDCPGEGGLIDDAFLPEPQLEKLPNRAIEEDEFGALENDDRIDNVSNMMDVPLPRDNKALSLVVEIDGHTYGLHLDHDTAEWDIIAEGEGFDRVREAHLEWLSHDIGEVTGGAPDPDALDDFEMPDEITTPCDMCGGSHVVSAQTNPLTAATGLYEYEGVCEETGNPVIITKAPDEFLDQ